jgi:hypothetical protein
VVELDYGFVRPQPAANLPTHHDLSGVLQHQQQDLEGLLAEKKTDAVLAQFSGANIQFEGSETNLARPRRGQIGHGK